MCLQQQFQPASQTKPSGNGRMQSVRDFDDAEARMHAYWADMETKLFAAEQFCRTGKVTCPGCWFRTDEPGCMLPVLRQTLGEFNFVNLG